MGRPKQPPKVLTGREAAFVQAVLEHPDLSSAAASLTPPLPVRTARDWVKRTAIAEAITAGRKALFDGTVTRLVSLQAKATRTLEDAMDDKPTVNVPWGVRTGAAKTVLEMGKEFDGVADAQQRVRRAQRIVDGKVAEENGDGDDVVERGLELVK